MWGKDLGSLRFFFFLDFIGNLLKGRRTNDNFSLILTRTHTPIISFLISFFIVFFFWVVKKLEISDINGSGASLAYHQ